MCPGCGEPIAMRSFLETIEELGVIAARDRGGRHRLLHGVLRTMDVDLRAGAARPRAVGGHRRQAHAPDALVFTLQGDGDMVNEGLQEVIHTAARGESVTCILLNNGVFGETGGHMTATTVLGQRTKNTLDGRDAEYHGYPILIGDLIAQLQGAAYVAAARCTTPAASPAPSKMFKRAFESQLAGEGFSFVEVLTMCPTGWFIPTAEGARLHDRDAGRGPHHGRAQGRRRLPEGLSRAQGAAAHPDEVAGRLADHPEWSLVDGKLHGSCASRTSSRPSGSCRGRAPSSIRCGSRAT